MTSPSTLTGGSPWCNLISWPPSNGKRVATSSAGCTPVQPVPWTVSTVAPMPVGEVLHTSQPAIFGRERCDLRVNEYTAQQRAML